MGCAPEPCSRLDTTFTSSSHTMFSNMPGMIRSSRSLLTRYNAHRSIACIALVLTMPTKRRVHESESIEPSTLFIDILTHGSHG